MRNNFGRDLSEVLHINEEFLGLSKVTSFHELNLLSVGNEISSEGEVLENRNSHRSGEKEVEVTEPEELIETKENDGETGNEAVIDPSSSKEVVGRVRFVKEDRVLMDLGFSFVLVGKLSSLKHTCKELDNAL